MNDSTSPIITLSTKDVLLLAMKGRIPKKDFEFHILFAQLSKVDQKLFLECLKDEVDGAEPTAKQFEHEEIYGVEL